jgi:hypothetical protein
MDIDFSALGQKVVFLFTNLPDFAIYICEFLIETQFFLPIDDMSD